MFKPLSAGIAALAALAAMLPTGSAVAADDYDEKRVVSRGFDCVQARGWGAAGSFAKAISKDSVVWEGRRNLHIYNSWGKAELRTCDRGYLEDGGKVGLRHTWTVAGSRVGSCVVGFGKVECTLSDTKSVTTQGMGWRTNVDGDETFNRASADVWAESTDTGYLTKYYHTVFVRFISPSGNAETNASATVELTRGD